MEELHIKIPKGYLIDEENSDLGKGIVIFKKENNLPNNWEEYYNSLSEKIKFSIDNVLFYLSGLPDNIKYKYTALFKLELLRDVYRQDWKPDYTNQEEKHIIIKKYNNLEEYWFTTGEHYFLSFQSEEIRSKFYNNFKDLIEKAEDLI